MIVLEVGARSLMEPSVALQVRSIIEDTLPQINTDVVQVKATFAELIDSMRELERRFRDRK